MRIWNAWLKCATRGSLQIQDAKITQKIVTCAPSHNFVGLYLRNDGMYCRYMPLLRRYSPTKFFHLQCIYQQSKKKLVKHHLLHMSSQPMVNFGQLTAEIGWRVWGTQQISTGCASSLRYCTDVAQQQSTKFCMMFGCLLGWYTTLCHKKTRKV